MHLTIQKQATACLPYSEKPTFSYIEWSVFHLEYVVGISVDNSICSGKYVSNPLLGNVELFHANENLFNRWKKYKLPPLRDKT